MPKTNTHSHVPLSPKYRIEAQGRFSKLGGREHMFISICRIAMDF